MYHIIGMRFHRDNLLIPRWLDRTRPKRLSSALPDSAEPSLPAVMQPGIAVRWYALLLWLLLSVLAVVGANMLSLSLQGHSQTFSIGVRADRHLLHGFFSQEEDASGTRYRWTKGESTISINGFATLSHPLLILNIGGIPPDVTPPRPVDMRTDEHAWMTLPVKAEPRRYYMLMPPDVLADGQLELGLRSDTAPTASDRRSIGIRLDSVAITWPMNELVLPTWPVLLVQWLIVLTVLGMAWRLEYHWTGWLIAGIATVVLLAVLTAANLFIASAWHSSLLVASSALLLLIWAVYPRLSHLLPGQPAQALRQWRWLLLLTIAVLGIRLLGSLYPVFDSHDWYIHEERLMKLQWGSLLLYDKPAEFSKRLAIVPPAFYLLVSPLSLLTANTVVVMQGFYAFLDGCSVLFLALLVRYLGGSQRAAVLAALILAFLPIQYTALWWGFGPQVVGQALTLLLALFVIQPRLRPLLLWAAATVLFTLIMLIHVGTALLAGFWLSGTLALSWFFHRRTHQHWHGWFIVIVVTALITIVLLYSEVITMHVRGLAGNERLAWTAEDYGRIWWTLGSLNVSFAPIGTLLAVVSLIALTLFTPLPQRWLLIAWVGTALLFFAVDLALGLQIRYAYFVVPLVCAGLGWLLDRMISRHWTGWLLCIGIIGLIAFAGLSLWFYGVVPGDKPSLRPLTH
ncbi:MAG: hypothetical protein HC837_15260 [Chloroflexaceae bacterium]|nr:hypothetical protein [Chloroflexaceae bacterium]